jgi:hypothetical protein
LTERFHGKDVYLVGTANQSTMLAQRTKKLIQELEPDTVIVQTSPEWWNSAKELKFVDSQEEMDKYTSRLDRYLGKKESYMWAPARHWLQLFRWSMYTALYMNFFKFPVRFDRPGLETKYACEAAEQVGARILFAGNELDSDTRKRIAHETRLNVTDFFKRRWQYDDTQWIKEKENAWRKMSFNGHSAFTEKCLDQYQVNWFVAATATFFPQFKKIFIDDKDEDLFNKLDNCKGDKIVIVVNQWHMEGIEHHWCHRYGQFPRSVEFPEGINPIGDMDLREGLFTRLYNIHHREQASSRQGAPPSTYADWIIGYHRESNFQYEHRDM